MSEITAVAFLLSGLALVAARMASAWVWTQALALAVMTISVTGLVGYAYSVEGLYSAGLFSSLALHTALGFGVLALCVLSFRPAEGIVGLFRSNTVGGMTARRCLPLVVAIPLLVGWLQLAGVRRSMFNFEFGTALLTVASVLLLFGLVWGYARWLDRAERDRIELESQVRRSQKMETAGRLAGGIAHDFNNLLTVAMTTAELVRRETDNAQVKADLEVILSAGRKATALTKQLLALGRRQVLHPSVSSLNDIVRDSDPIVTRLVPGHVTYAVHLADDLGNVVVDAGQMEQVLINLIINAVDAMPGEGRLRVETRNADLDTSYTEHHTEVEPGPYVSLIVSDSGVGMDKATMQSIFEPFFTTKAPGKGTGLGLATAYGIVRQSRGHIWVYSEAGQGTTFKIYLPRVNQQASHGKSPTVVSASPKKSGTVLVVDDNDAVRDLVAKILRREGYLVHEAVNGVDALRVAEGVDGPIDLVITDVVMPEMGAAELTERLRNARANIPFLFMSGYADERLADEGLLEAEAGLLEKPFMPEELLRGVRDVLAGGA